MFPDEMIVAFQKIDSRNSLEKSEQWMPENESFPDPSARISEKKEFDFSSSSEHRFFADTPYYDAFVEKEIHSAEVLYNTLKDIGTETQSFSRTTSILWKSFRSLSLACRQGSNTIRQGTNQKRVELAPEINMLEALAETLEEISAAHKNMFDIIETFLGYHMMELALKQMAVINKLKKEKKEVEIQTKYSEQEICNYLNGKNAACTVAGHSNKFLDPAEAQKTIFSVPNPIERKWSIEDSQRRSHELRWSQRIRMEETTAEIKRFQLIKNIVSANYEQRFELSRSNGEALFAMRNCFQTCLDKVAKNIPYVDINQKQCSDYQDKKKPLWEEREKSLLQTLTTMKRAGEISLPHGLEELTEIERDAHIWDLPCELATVSKFRRPSPRDVLMEGWLYQKCSSIMPLKSPWMRRWFILKSSGIYYLESSAEGRKSEINKFKVKLFDLVLCTVKELPNEPSARFCFELIDPSNRKAILQARGPKELQMWLDSIRSAVGSGLAKSNYEIKSGLSKIRRISSEIALTVLDRKTLQVYDEENSSDSASTSVCNTSEDSFITSETDSAGDMENPLIMEILKANPKCADCGASSPCWVSLNLGILVCLECSGVHRSLGCHVSKVRSLKLDTLSSSEASLLLSLGNERANKIWEREMKPDSKALKEAACSQDRSIRENWIKRKYVQKEFIGRSSNMNAESEEKLSRKLHAASERGDVIGIAAALAHGANLDWKNNEGKDGPCTALEIAIMQADAGKNGAVECTELLLQNGAKTTKDDDFTSPGERKPS